MVVHAIEGESAVNPRTLRPRGAAGGGGDPLRGILMSIAAVIAFWRGWQIHRGHYAWMAYALGVLALGLATWHFASSQKRS
jgi:hypothetical protein